MISQQITDLLQGLQRNKPHTTPSEGNDSSIKINAITGKAGAIYEKMRYLVDYKEEHTIRRSAIERIIKRKLVFELMKSDNISLKLLQELVSGGYLPNDTISENVAIDVEKILNKYLNLKNVIEARNGKIENVYTNALISLTASEIDYFLYPTDIENAVADSFHKTLLPNIKYKGNINEAELSPLLYIASRRSLLKNDNETLLYAMWQKYNPNHHWDTDETEIEKVATSFKSVIDDINRNINDDRSWSMMGKLKNTSIYFSLILEMIHRYGAESASIFENHEYLDEKITELLKEKYETDNHALTTGATRATIYILLTKVVLALALEFPYEHYILKQVDYFPLATNIIFHPVLLMFIALSTPKLDKENTNRILSGVHDIIYKGTIKTIKIKGTPGVFHTLLFSIMYSILFIISFGVIITVLEKLNFNIAGKGLFVLFIALVSYFGLRIRHNALRYKVNTNDDGIISLLWNFFTLPIVSAGRWLSRKFSSINVFVFIMDILIEAPFKIVLATFDSFITFLKEKKEENY